MTFQYERIGSYRAFWPFYVSQHQSKLNRNLHFLGTLLAFACLYVGVAENAWFLLGVPLCGYGFAWFGHLAFERNQPATWRYPFWSLFADCQMFAFMCAGRMDREVKRMGILHQEFRASPHG